MAKQTIVYTSLVGGEVSPEIQGRIDTEKYYSSLGTQENSYTRP